MSSFGEEIRRERELRQISLREVAEATKINLRYLEALEVNDFSDLPGGVFNRGFVRAYADFIGVDPDAMVNAYLLEDSTQTDNAPSGDSEVLRGYRAAIKSRDGESPDSPTAPLPWKRWAIIAAAALVVLIGGFLLLRGRWSSAETEPSTTDVRPSSPIPPAPAKGESSTSTDDPPSGDESGKPGGDGADAPRPAPGDTTRESANPSASEGSSSNSRAGSAPLLTASRPASDPARGSTSSRTRSASLPAGGAPTQAGSTSQPGRDSTDSGSAPREAQLSPVDAGSKSTEAGPTPNPVRDAVGQRPANPLNRDIDEADATVPLTGSSKGQPATDSANQAATSTETTVFVDRSVTGRINCDNSQIEVLDGIRPGTKLRLNCASYLIVDASDAGALRISLPGRTTISLGPDGQRLSSRYIAVRRAAGNGDSP